MAKKIKSQDTLTIQNLQASIDEKPILRGLDMVVAAGEVHAIMGPNGSGKSTLAHVLLGHPSYVAFGEVKLSVGGTTSNNVLDISTEERAKKGIFLAFQTPIAIPGVTVMSLLRTAYMQVHAEDAPKPLSHNPVLSGGTSANISMAAFVARVKEVAAILHIDPTFLQRGLHDAFSGGEKKKIEMLQALILKPKFAIFDEIDTGLDVDALKIVAKGIAELAANGCGVIVITHYQRILEYTTPDHIHVLVKGKIVASGDHTLAKQIEKQGYKTYM